MGVESRNGMSNPDPPNSVDLPERLRELLRADADNVDALCETGRELVRSGQAPAADLCYRAALDAMRRVIRARNAPRALYCEGRIFDTFVKATEDEQHYRRFFSEWKEDMVALGHEFRDFGAPPDAGGKRIAFVLHTGHVLGHTEVLLKLLESRPRAGEQGAEPRIYVMDSYDREFLERCRAAGVEVVLAERDPYHLRFLRLKARFRQDRVGICIWVSIAANSVSRAGFSRPRLRISTTRLACCRHQPASLRTPTSQPLSLRV